MIKKAGRAYTQFTRSQITHEQTRDFFVDWIKQKTDTANIGLTGLEPTPSNLQTECSPYQATILFGSQPSFAYIVSVPNLFFG